ncbi:MAG TPA: bifunctional aspartate kinase/homoserine dehydrogenase I [Bacteroidales bacterium]|jgi:aspartokinase/homoserine dehydrogenase 1|nr:bifunctional aspartate kinase/homoserine dehydrogenase I [Bacteroidales bacterium]
MKVLKFGGSSVGSPEGLKQVEHIVASHAKPVIVIVSAFQDITNKLEAAAALASTKNTGYTEIFTHISEAYTTAVKKTITTTEQATVLETVTGMLKELAEILEGVYKLNDLTPKVHDRILSFGELISANIIWKAFKDAQFLDSRDLIVTDSNYGNAQIDFAHTNKNIEKALKEFNGICVVPGFIAADSEGNTTTIGRGGSDFSAAIYAAALNADILEIWTDVDGFMTADPRKVNKAFAIKSLSYAEAMELSHFGARVVYSPTIQPTFQKKIPIRIKNTFDTDAAGTLISEKSIAPNEEIPVKGVSSIDDIDLITLQGPGMVGTKGTSSRLFGALADKDVNIILITQASSEYSITFAISPKDTEKAVRSIEAEFEREIHIRNEVNIVVEKDLSIIAIVGEGMKNVPGISATLFQSLGRNGISVIATAQGSSELNISVVIRKGQLKKALNVIHEGFFLSNFKELHLYIVGTGTVGSSFIQQIKQQRQHLLDDHKLKVNVVGISRSRKMAINPEGIDLDNYLEEIERGQTADMHAYVDAMRELNLRNSVFVDCTADDNVSKIYKKVLDAYVSVVTANKVACSSDFKHYQELKRTAVHNNVKFMFETNVGAGLPIINTMNDLIRSGDKILQLEAVLSGTLNFLFNTLSEEVPMSKAIKMAKDMGYSEPDPRIDLSGIDVIRKLVILAREAGYPLEQKDVKVNSFLPAACFEGTLDDFWKKVAEYDNEFEAKRKELVEKGLKWRFIAKLDCGVGEVGLETVDMLHPAYPLEGSNNILLLTTERYKDAPMVIRGYGAGADVTAAGVFADVIRVANV